jgi:putative transposase
MRSLSFDAGSHYLLSSSGAGEQNIFLDRQDVSRFLFLILFFVSPIPIYNTDWYINMYLKKGRFSIGTRKASEISKERYIDLLAFNIKKDGFSILVKNLSHGVVSVYMHRALSSYSKYFCKKYKKSGRVFNGPFKARLVENKKELIDLSSMINTREIEGSTGDNVYLSSYDDYTGDNRWGNYLDTSDILRAFKTKSDYKKFIQKSQGSRNRG